MKYGGFLAVILVLQLGVEISLYVYKHKLLEIFDRSLNQSFINSNSGKDNFDLMQSTVSKGYILNSLNLSYHIEIYFF